VNAGPGALLVACRRHLYSAVRAGASTPARRALFRWPLGRRLVIAAFAALVVLPRTATAHLGSPDVFLDARAGPYRLFVTVRPPRVIPGVAEVEVLTSEADVREVRIVPMPLAGPGAQFAPAPDLATRSRDDPRLYTGRLWMMTAGAWQVRVAVDGSRGSGVVAVPVPTLPQATLDMSPALRAGLFALMVLLSAGFVSIVAALWREAALEPGRTPGRPARRRGRIAGTIAAAIVVAVVVLGNLWWAAEASSYARYVYKPLEASTAVTPDGRLTLALRDPGWISLRRMDDLVADHGHLMHLFLLSPALDRFWHLHPGEASNGTFEQQLPDVPQGEYELFADVVHSTGLPETITGRLATSEIQGSRLTGDDSAWSMPASGVAMDAAPLQDGGRMVWVRDGRPLEIGRLTLFTFRVDDAAGSPASDLELYMGMPGHAIFVSRDRRVFAHVHPSGSAPMAAMQLGERSLGGGARPLGHDHTGRGGSLPAVVSFPFGLPEPGDYRIFVQIKRRGRIETGAFDARVD
jgi:hypothetical protein